MSTTSRYFNFSIFSSLLLVLFCFNPVKAIPPEQILPKDMTKLQDLGGAWIPLNNNEAMYGDNLDEGSYQNNGSKAPFFQHKLRRIESSFFNF
ncbi:MAG: hypothetical protein IGQ45_00540 [Cyanobacterium sp. T60_A2020_053]|nr:hypothetical protein [Cyanobacterium sp. T60_A2020_053]